MIKNVYLICYIFRYFTFYLLYLPIVYILSLSALIHNISIIIHEMLSTFFSCDNIKF